MNNLSAGRVGIRVLLISAEAESRRAMALLLRKAGFETSCESTGAVATSPLVENRTLANHFDVIVVDEPDTLLNEIDDEELPELLTCRNIEVPVVALSVMLSRDKMAEAGYRAVVAKPVCPESLFAAILACQR
ncbi:MAG: response regulator [Planctomycetaceae bacterium]|nr:response regulator [Planctomycetaceae bacterium]